MGSMSTPYVCRRAPPCDPVILPRIVSSLFASNLCSRGEVRSIRYGLGNRHPPTAPRAASYPKDGQTLAAYKRRYGSNLRLILKVSGEQTLAPPSCQRSSSVGRRPSIRPHGRRQRTPAPADQVSWLPPARPPASAADGAAVPRYRPPRPLLPTPPPPPPFPPSPPLADRPSVPTVPAAQARVPVPPQPKPHGRRCVCVRRRWWWR